MLISQEPEQLQDPANWTQFDWIIDYSFESTQRKEAAKSSCCIKLLMNWNKTLCTGFFPRGGLRSMLSLASPEKETKIKQVALEIQSFRIWYNSNPSFLNCLHTKRLLRRKWIGRLSSFITRMNFVIKNYNQNTFVIGTLLDLVSSHFISLCTWVSNAFAALDFCDL